MESKSGSGTPNIDGEPGFSEAVTMKMALQWASFYFALVDKGVPQEIAKEFTIAWYQEIVNMNKERQEK